MITSLVDCMKEEIPEGPTLVWQEKRFSCHREQLVKNLSEFESHLSAAIPREEPANIYCWDRKRYLQAKRLLLMERWTQYARLIIKNHHCLGSKDIQLFYKHKKDTWMSKQKDWFKEYSQQVNLNTNYGKMYAKFEKDLENLTKKASELDDTKFPCKSKVAEINSAWTGIKTKDSQVETLRGATQDVRFEVETVTHRLKHYRTLCEVKEKRFKQSKTKTNNTNNTTKYNNPPTLKKSNTFAQARFAEVQVNKSDLSEDEFVHPQLKEDNNTPFNYKNARINPRLKSKKTKMTDEIPDEAKEEEEAELRVCGVKCRVVPASIRATFIHTMFDDQVRLQSGVAMTWNVLNKQNKLGQTGKLGCIEVEKEIGTVETEINEVNDKIAKITSQINQCTAQKQEEKIRKEMWLYWIYKVENQVERERVMGYRKKQYSRNHLRAYLIFFGEVISSIPDISKSECENWDVSKGLLDSRMAVLTEQVESETSQQTEFNASKTELNSELTEAYPCQQAFECTVIGETYYGDRERHICNIIEESEINPKDEEDCRFEFVVDPKDTPAGDAKAKTLPLTILMSNGDKFFCGKESPISPTGWVEQEAKKGIETDPNTPTEASKDQSPAAVSFFDMQAARKRQLDELTEAEGEIPSFDVTRHEQCLSCGTLGIEKFVCKSKLKIFTGNTATREKNGLAQLKTIDEKGDFIENSNVKCEAANFMVTVQDEMKQVVRTKDIAFYLCSTVSSDETKAKFDFTDPAYCQRCEKFDPENDIMVDGEQGNVDSEQSITLEEEPSKKELKKEGDKDSINNKKDETQTPLVMTNEMKLSVLKNTFKDWLEQCDIQTAPIENMQVELEATKYTPMYLSAGEDLKERWLESRCELDQSQVNDLVGTQDCLYSPSVEDPEKYVLQFKLVKRARDMNGKKSASVQQSYYTMLVCDKPQGQAEISEEEQTKKKLDAIAKKHKGVVDGREPDSAAFQMNPILYFAVGRECMKVCDQGTYINLLEMKFTKEELKGGSKTVEATAPDNRFKLTQKQKVKQFLSNNNIVSKMEIITKDK